MRDRALGIMAAVVLGTFGLLCAAEDTQEKETAAQKAAEEWLTLVDAGKYEESWNTAAQFFKKAVLLTQWQASAAAARNPFGKMIERKLKAKQYATTLPGAPPGEYVMMQFETSFEKGPAIETITPMLDPDGKWRVSGYFIKPANK